MHCGLVTVDRKRIQRANDVTRARETIGQPVNAATVTSWD